MPQITILPENKVVDAPQGTVLLQALLGAGAAIQHKCGGNAKCGSCHFYLQEGKKSVNRISPTENAMLDTIVGVGSKSRLACQVVVGSENLVVELLTFASGR
jgi:2Fe-2S ferredoxin